MLHSSEYVLPSSKHPSNLAKTPPPLAGFLLSVNRFYIAGVYAPAFFRKIFCLRHIGGKNGSDYCLDSGRTPHGMPAQKDTRVDPRVFYPRRHDETDDSCQKERGIQMGQIRFDKDKHTKKKWLSGKGFYVALAVCLVAVCGVAVVTFIGSLPAIFGQDTSDTPETSTTEKPVDTPVTNVPDDRTTTSTTTTTPPTTTTTKADVPTNNDPMLLLLPLTNEVVVPYSDGKPVFSETMQDWRVHTGTDFKGETGQDIKAIADGTISSIDSDPLWGAIIVVDHGNDMQSRYCGASPSGIEEGMAVKAGQVIGVVSDIPCETVTGAHLHLEILVKGQLVDPVKTIGREVKYTETPSGEE